MKRFVIAIAMVILIIGIGILSVVQLRQITDVMSGELDNMVVAVQARDKESLLKRTEQFQKLWEEEERSMMRYIHHDELDAITGTVARLEALAEYEDYPELAAEIDRLRHLVRHIYESEMPSLTSIF